MLYLSRVKCTLMVNQVVVVAFTQVVAETAGKRRKSCETMGDRRKPSETVGNRWKSIKIMKNH